MDSDGQVFYELCEMESDEHHDHIVCMDCRRIFEFHDEGIEARQAQISKEMGFVAEKHTHVIYAKCQYLNEA
jgi:Fur family ferric uptake transcriptional regulator